MDAHAESRPLLVSYLGLVQFLFLLTWVVYVIFLGDLLGKMGLPKDFVPRLLLLDQLLFACADVLLGVYADRAMRLLRRIAPLLLALARNRGQVHTSIKPLPIPHAPAGRSPWRC